MLDLYFKIIRNPFWREGILREQIVDLNFRSEEVFDFCVQGTYADGEVYKGWFTGKIVGKDVVLSHYRNEA